jgi:branched-chain amino acid transport system substrate-binding protein
LLRAAILGLCIGCCSSLLACSPAPLSIGFIGPMTGPTANIGVEGYRGFSLAIAEINAEGGPLGRKLIPLMIDDAADPALCLAAAREMVSRGIKLIVLHTTSGAAAGALPYLLEQDALVLTRTVSDPAWVGLDDGFLRFVGSTELFGSTLGAFARGRGKQGLAIIIDQRNSSYADSMTRGSLPPRRS